MPEAVWLNNTICIDTGCVFGGKLTALRWPEREVVSVPAHRQYWEPARPLEPDTGAAAAPDADREPTDLDIADVLGKKILATRLTGHTVTIREENAVAALEVDEPLRRRPALAGLPATHDGPHRHHSP